MRKTALGFAIAAAALALGPHGAAAQCEGGTTAGGFYTRSGAYQPGGCVTTNPSTPSQMYPSGAQPAPSTNPALGLSALPGQPLATGLLPVTGADASQPLGAGVPQGPILGPGAPSNVPVITLPGMAGGTNALPGQVSGVPVPQVNTANVGSALGMEGISNGLTNTVNNGATTGLGTPNINGAVNPVTATDGLPNSVTSAGGVNGVVNPVTGTEGLPNSITSTGSVSGVRYPGINANLGGVNGVGSQLSMPLPSVSSLNPAYSFALPMAPARADAPVSPAAPSISAPPPAPGRGGPTFIGEDRPTDTIVSYPNQ